MSFSHWLVDENRGVDRYPIDRYPALRITGAQEVAGRFSAHETGGALTRWMVGENEFGGCNNW